MRRNKTIDHRSAVAEREIRDDMTAELRKIGITTLIRIYL
jgi:hypothetical protein